MIKNTELTITRIYNASREILWRYWTDEKLVSQWWGPRGVSNPTCIWDVKPQGDIHIVMLAGEELGPLKGQQWPMTGKFLKIKEPEMLEFTSCAIMEGKPILETLVTVTLEDVAGKTKMTVHIMVTKTTPEAQGPLKGMEAGWNQQLDKLGEAL